MNNKLGPNPKPSEVKVNATVQPDQKLTAKELAERKVETARLHKGTMERMLADVIGTPYETGQRSMLAKANERLVKATVELAKFQAKPRDPVKTPQEAPPVPLTPPQRFKTPAPKPSEDFPAVPDGPKAPSMKLRGLALSIAANSGKSTSVPVEDATVPRGLQRSIAANIKQQKKDQ